MLWRLLRELPRRTVRTMLLLAWLAAGAQGYGASSLIGLIVTFGGWRWARRSLRDRGWAYETAMRMPSWVRWIVIGHTRR